MLRATGGVSAGFWRTARGTTLALIVAGVLVGHVPFLASATPDIDGANLALGLRDFDVAAHRPHPPGYPILVALGRLVAVPWRLLPAAPPQWGGALAPEVRALALLSVLSGALALVPLFTLYLHVEPDADIALAAVALTAAAPLVWFTDLRPLTDMPGLLAALVVQALTLGACTAGEEDRRSPLRGGLHRQRLRTAAFLAGLAAGVRVQTVWLTLPLLGVAMSVHARRDGLRDVGITAGLVVAGVLAWAVPLLAASGGLSAYLDAVVWQAGDDLRGVSMLSTRPSLRLLAQQIDDTWVRPWATIDAARVALGLAAIGGVAMLARSRRGAGLLMLAFLPYAVAHHFAHETDEVRYAVPLIPFTAYLMARGLRTIVGARGLPIATTVVVAGLLAVTLPAYASFVGYPPPAFEAVGEIDRQLRLEGHAGARVAGHQPFQRALEVSQVAPGRMLPTPMFHEQLELVRYWREGGDGPVLFIRDPRRTNLALVDPESQHVLGRYRWRFPRRRFLSGIRPDLADLVRIAPAPAWFCAEGWHLTPETLGVAERRGRQDATAYIRRTPDARLLVFGAALVGRGDRDVRVRIDVTVNGRPVLVRALDADEPHVVAIERLAPGALEGDGPYAELTARYRSDGDRARVRFTHFAVESGARPFAAFAEGWHEQEYDPTTDRTWRWTSGRAEIVIYHAGRDLTLRLSGESPLKYFDDPPAVTVLAGERVLSRFSPIADFSEEVIVPAAALARARGVLTLVTDRTFVPAERSASPDRRPLGLRIWEITLR